MFTYGETVLVKTDAAPELRPGHLASVVGITTERERSGCHFDQFLSGTIYLVEFDDGKAIDVHENQLEGSGA